MRTINLTKGGNLNLTKDAASLKTMCLGLGWDVQVTDGADFDLDAVAFLVTSDGKVRSNDDFIFFGQKESACGAVTHTGDNLTGEGEGDDEQILVDLSKIPTDVEKVVFCAVIYDADARDQNFGQVSNAFIRIVDSDKDEEVARYDLSEDASLYKAMIFAELYRHNGDWKFKAVGQGFEDGLKILARAHGVDA